MSIYDEPAPDQQPLDTRDLAEPLETAAPIAGTKKKRRGWGCASCLGGCAVVSLVCVVLLVVSGVVVWNKLPDWMHESLVAAIVQSDLPEDEKQQIVAQIDRVYDEYKADNMTIQQMFQVAEQLAESPLFTLAMAFAATENYVKPSGLNDEEKQTAQLTLQRVARGVFEEMIDPQALESALDYISTKDFNGQRQFHADVSDQDLREMLAECRRLADNAQVPDEPFEVNIGEELKRAVDQTLADG